MCSNHKGRCYKCALKHGPPSSLIQWKMILCSALSKKDLRCFIRVLCWILLKSRRDSWDQTPLWPAALRTVRSHRPQASIFHTWSRIENIQEVILQCHNIKRAGNGRSIPLPLKEHHKIPTRTRTPFRAGLKNLAPRLNLQLRLCKLTRPPSTQLVTMTMPLTFCSQIILQKSLTVDGSGPWVAMYSLLFL